MIRARAYEAMGDALFWRAVRALYARALRSDWRILKVRAKPSLRTLFSQGGYQVSRKGNGAYRPCHQLIPDYTLCSKLLRGVTFSVPPRI